MENFVRISLFMILSIAIFLIGALIFRNQLLTYLKKAYKDVYDKIHPYYSKSQLMMGGPDQFIDILLQEKYILSKKICLDSEVKRIQKRYKIFLLLLLISLLSWIGYVLIITDW